MTKIKSKARNADIRDVMSLDKEQDPRMPQELLTPSPCYVKNGVSLIQLTQKNEGISNFDEVFKHKMAGYSKKKEALQDTRNLTLID